MIKEINSTSNPTFKSWQKLTKKKHRDETGLFLMEGEVLLLEAIKEKRPPREIIICGGNNPDLEDQKARYSSLFDGNIYILAPDLFQKLSQTENGRDIMAVMEKPDCSLKRLKSRLKKNPETKGNILVLDRLQDPGNVGTIIRTGDAFGVDGILIMKGSADIFSPKVVRAAAGSIMRLPLVFVEGEDELFDLTKELGLKLIATGLKNAETVYQADLSGGQAIVIGNEGQGVSETILERAEKIITIPMEGEIDSLNAGIATSIILYECVRQKSINKRG